MARMLLVEDDESIRGILRRALEAAGHSVAVASDGREALAALPTVKPDLVITDIVMPEKEGIQTIIEVRKADPKIKTLAISGGGRIGSPDLLAIASKVGADGILAKPIRLDELRRAVDSILASKPLPQGGKAGAVEAAAAPGSGR